MDDQQPDQQHGQGAKETSVQNMIAPFLNEENPDNAHAHHRISALLTRDPKLQAVLATVMQHLLTGKHSKSRSDCYVATTDFILSHYKK
jgi:hypothetical protein